ncbi:MAG: SDR family oxidoreductase [Peptococcaceae bacterium]|nr:SDR family oxidoreductase [Peptococcaceae bacterium]MDH7525386.1 SDR family oxidoreductase [Peptococcaceae bacterium]
MSGPVNLVDKKALVVGGSGSIGSAICRALAREGAHVLVADVAGMDKVKAEIEKLGNKVLEYYCDLTREEEIKTLVSTIINEHDRIDILVYAAGIMHPTHLEKITLEEWNLELAINLTGAFLLVRSVLPIMKKQGGGKIVFLGSVAGKIGGIKSGAHYVVTKAGLHALAKWIARDGGPYGVYANSVAPGPVVSKMTDGLDISPDSFPLGRLGKPEDIAEAVVYLASNASNWVTGTVFDVNGGILME